MSNPQRDREAAALADLALDEYSAVVRIDELLGDGQSEAASLRLRTGHAEIAVEDALMITRVYAATEILNIDIDPVVMLLGAHDDTGEWWIALDSRLVTTHATFSLSTNSFDIFSGYSTST